MHIYIYTYMWSHNVLFPAGSIAFLFAKPFVSSHGRPVCLPLQCPWVTVTTRYHAFAAEHEDVHVIYAWLWNWRPETLASLANSGTSNLGGLGKLHWWWGAQCSHSAFWNLVVPCDPKITLEKWMAVVNLMWIWDIIFYSKPIEALELSQKTDQCYERCSKWSMPKRDATTPQSMMS